ncbi:TrmH family RNA methyltransferase [Paenibacillus campinasensis]|uniref:rRNA methyltransferase n=1 Tax=Paenibacillus campinasensis TaxID=66347 RepID=A0A268EXQ2_9BACL|nr:RNA methyltransferase [Paenibacillus campinasensis]PAD77908.1 rRNA methyltransferase [Paenibacillus campinasensis]
MEILSPQNARVKAWAQLQEKKHRDKQQKYIIEGIHLVQEALQAGADIECVTYDVEKGIPHELKAATVDTGQAIEWIGVSPAVIAKVSDTPSPQPTFAVVRKESRRWQELLLHEEGLVVVLDGLQDPGNVGTIIRSADASGAAGVLLGRGCADLYNPKTIRSTMGSLFHLPVVEGDLLTILPEARERGARMVTTSLAASRSCYEYDFGGNCWMVIGSEGRGVSPEVEALVDDTMIIPMPGKAESLNAAMAASVLLFEALRQRML